MSGFKHASRLAIYNPRKAYTKTFAFVFSLQFRRIHQLYPAIFYHYEVTVVDLILIARVVALQVLFK